METNFGDLIRPHVPHDALKSEVTEWSKKLRDRICASYEAIEAEAAKIDAPTLKGHTETGKFERTEWNRPKGGGVIALMRGRVFEKVGVNVSSIWGEFSPEFRRQIPGAEEDPRFFVAGISVVSHPCSPKVPTAQFKTHLIVTTQGWFSGDANITPTFPDSPNAHLDAELFHERFRLVCDKYDRTYYERFKRWCEESHYIQHRKESRGMGGIFFDWLRSTDVKKDLNFIKELGETWLLAYPEIVKKRMTETWTDEDRQTQLVKRGRYAEYKMLYDRGTVFGLKTGGNAESIMMSLPPLVAWP